MEFINPSFLFALTALSIPVLIHLFNLRRYKKEYFTNVRFLTQIQQETRKRSQLKQLLILLARLLAISSLVLAFSQPYLRSAFQKDKSSVRHAVSIYIDNSYSMENVGPGGRLFESAKQKAVEIVSAYKSSDIFQLMTNDLEGKYQQFVSRDEFLGMLKEVNISSATLRLSEIISRQNEVFSEQHDASPVVFLISDFQKSTSDLGNSKPDSLSRFVLVPVESLNRNNLYIDSIWFPSPVHRPGQTTKLNARVRNCGTESLEKIPLRLSVNNIQKAVTSFNIGPGQTIDITVPFTENFSGIQLGSLELTDFPVTYDDKFFFSYNIVSEIQVLSIYGNSENPYLKTLFATDSSFEFHSYQSSHIDYNHLNSQNLITISGINELSSGLSQELKFFLEQGGSIIIFPPDKQTLETYNQFLRSVGAATFGNLDTLKQRVASLDLENEIFKDVFEKDASGTIQLPENADLPVVLRFYPITIPMGSETVVLMKLQNGLPFLTCTSYAKGKLYLLASPSDPLFTNFQQHILFVPVLFKIAFLSERQQNLYYIVGKNEGVRLPFDSVSGKMIVKIRKYNGNQEFIPEIKSNGQIIQGYVHGQVREAGWYYILLGNKILSGIAFNYDRKESDLNCYNSSEIKEIIKKHSFRNFFVINPSGTPIYHQVEQLNMGTPLWKWLIILAILFIGAEIMIIRLIKT
jgi:hypothetical protein